MATYRRIIELSLLEIGVLDEDENASEAAISNGFEILRGMLDEWLLDGDMSPGISRITHQIGTAEGDAKQTYTVGRGNNADGEAADIVADNPFRIPTLAYQRAGFQESRPLIQVDAREWESIYSTHTSWPGRFYLERDYPHARISFDTLTEHGDRFHFLMEKEFALGSVDAEAVLPPAYTEAIRLNLAVRLAPSHGMSANNIQQVIRTAQMAKTRLQKRNIAAPDTVRLDPALTQRNDGWGQLYGGGNRWRW